MSDGLHHGPIAMAPLTREQAAAIAEVLHALGDRTRVQIVSALLQAPTGELHARDLREQLDLRQPTASHHLHKLLRAGILLREQRGPYAYFRLEPEAFMRLRELFGEPDLIRPALQARPGLDVRNAQGVSISDI
ncbi:MAG: ArsR/SmtB family transcription factor [Solirubrobacteraceae bacterium]